MPMNQFYHFSENGTYTLHETIEDALQKRETGGFIWLSYNMPRKEELSRIIGIFGIHPLSIEDCFDEDQIPKIDIFREYTSILFNDFYYHDKLIKITEMNLFLGETFLVTVSREETEKQHPVEKILQDMRRNREHNLQGPAFLMHSILDHIVDRKFITVETIEDEIITLEDAMIASPVRFSPQELQTTKRNLMAMRKSVLHEREILIKICRKDSLYIPENSVFFYSDILDHLVKFYETIETNRDIVTSLIQMNLSSTSNAMAEAANRTNRSVSRLTMITTICMPLTLIAGIGGMSEWSMMTGPENWHIAYPLLMFGMTVAAIFTYFLLKWYNRK